MEDSPDPRTEADMPGNPSPATMWQHKPWWCQPWTIVLTGIGATVLSWFVLRMIWLTLLVTVAVLSWWVLFLVLVPRAWREALAADNDDQA